MPKHKCKFTDELKKKYPRFRLGRDASEAECMTCRAGTYVSVANKGGSDLEAHVHSAKHKTAARGESSSSKVTDFFVSAACYTLSRCLLNVRINQLTALTYAQ